MTSTPRRSGVVVPHQLNRRQQSVALLIYLLIKSVTATLRMTWRDESGIIGKSNEPILFCLWHNRLALAMKIYSDYVQKHHPGAGLAALISASKDGAMLAAVLSRFGVQPVRGSSSRRGPQSLVELVSWTRKGYLAAITPDGPRGPRYQVQEGIISLAQLTGLAVVPVSTHLHGKILLKSWDQFQVPVPFSRCEVRFGKPILIPREADDAHRAVLRKELQDRMSALTQD